MMPILKQKSIAQLFCTKIGWLAICMVLVVIFGSVSSHSAFFDGGPQWCWYAMLICLIYPVILCLIMIGYAIRNTFFNKNGKI